MGGNPMKGSKDVANKCEKGYISISYCESVCKKYKLGTCKDYLDEKKRITYDKNEGSKLEKLHQKVFGERD